MGENYHPLHRQGRQMAQGQIHAVTVLYHPGSATQPVDLSVLSLQGNGVHFFYLFLEKKFLWHSLKRMKMQTSFCVVKVWEISASKCLCWRKQAQFPRPLALGGKGQPAWTVLP